MVLWCLWHVLLLATATSTELTNVNGRADLQHGAAEAQGHTATPLLSWQHAAPSQPAGGPRDAPPDAAYSAHLSILLLLLQHSANPDLQDTYGVTALNRAAEYTATSRW